MKAKTVFFCTDCGNETPKWQGQCPKCGSWNTLVEQTAVTKDRNPAVSRARRSAAPLHELDTTAEIRFQTGMRELDRVLGGGAVNGSLVLVSGAPGIGKSTLLLQICGFLSASSRILYVTGEESERQLKMRAERLGIKSENLFVLSETDLGNVLEETGSLQPDILIADSIQTLYNSELNSAPGSVAQVKECTMSLMQLAKGQGVTVFIIGHVNKEGAIAGPKVLEHMVDCVLYFEGEESSNYRILRAAKNRFGSTNEIGVFEMTDKGLSEVENPSELLLSERPVDAPGTCVTCVIEGTRPILAEIQALLTPTSFNVPRRNFNGVDFNRTTLLLAVLEKRSGLRISGCDAYVNVIGGLYLSEPAADLAAVLAIASSYRDKPLDSGLTAIGEVGLTGELRSVAQINQRLSEIARLGFKKCILPKKEKGQITKPEGLEIIQVESVSAALKAALQ